MMFALCGRSLARSSLRRGLQARPLSQSVGTGGRSFSGRTVVASSAVGAISAAVAVRQLMMPAADPNAGRPENGSLAVIDVQPQAKRVVRVLYRHADGTPKLARIDEATFTAEAERAATELEQARGPLLANASHALHRRLDEALLECQGPDRVKAFASWYYAYTTTYELMRVAVSAATAAIPTEQSSREAATQAVAAAVLEKYEAIVLRPAQTEPVLKHAFGRASAAAQADVLQTLGLLNAKSLRLLERHSTHLDASGARGDGHGDASAQLVVDWRSARGTAAGIDLAHARPSGMPSIALLGGGAVVGKAAASAAGKAAATAVTKAMAGKLAAPFVAKLGSAMAPAAASVGAAAGGPVGVVIGAGVGLAVDYALSKGVELAGRGEFEKDVAFALRTAQGELRYAMESELRRAVGVLVDDAVQLTADAYQAREVSARAALEAPTDEAKPAADLAVAAAPGEGAGAVDEEPPPAPSATPSPPPRAAAVVA